MSHGSQGGNMRRQERQHSRRNAHAGGNVVQQIRAAVEQRTETVPSFVKRADARQTGILGGSLPIGGNSGSSSSSSSSSNNGGSGSGSSSSDGGEESSSSASRSFISRVSTKSSTSSQTSQYTPSTSSTSSQQQQQQQQQTTSYSRSSSSSSAIVESTYSPSSSSSSSSVVIATRTVQPTTSHSITPLTSVALVTSSSLPTDNAAASTSPKSDSNSLGAGPIVGIVAGSLAGLAVLAVIAGFLIKKMRRKEDPYEANPFDRDEFRRSSMMLDDGQDGAGFGYQEYQPPMSEMPHGGASYGMHGGHPGFDEYGNMIAAGAAGGAATAGGYALSQDEHGRPRPPTMFQRHLEHQASFNTAYEVPPTPVRMRSDGEMPQLPDVAYGGSDPYSLAGVGRQGGEDNINNPYGYLDRRSPLPRKEPNYGSFAAMPAGMDAASTNAVDHATAGRPGTSEGRSGTPDLPNLQQTYAMGGVVPSASNGSSNHFQYHGNMASAGSGGQLSADAYSPNHQMMASPQAMYDAPQKTPSPPMQPAQQSLQVRNQRDSQQHRPLSTATEGDENAAYDGVW